MCETTLIATIQKKQPLRALIEINNAQITIFPIAATDLEAETILDAFRSLRVSFDELRSGATEAVASGHQ